MFEALVRTALGETELALGLLEQACNRRDSNLLYLETEARFRPLAAEPRYTALLARLKSRR